MVSQYLLITKGKILTLQGENATDTTLSKCIELTSVVLRHIEIMYHTPDMIH